MNNNYMYSNYQQDNMRANQGRAVQTGGIFFDNMLSPFVNKSASFYLTFPESSEWRDTILKGTIQEAGKDYTVILDSTTNKPVLLLNKYIDYVIFDMEMN